MAFVLAQALGAGALAQPAAPLRALVLEPVDAEVMERIRGQTADLGWSLDVVATAADSPSLAIARRAADERAARAVLWVRVEPDGALSLLLFDARASRLLQRRFPVEPAHDPHAVSAAREGLALAVRGGLRALAAGDALGERVDGDSVATGGGGSPSSRDDASAGPGQEPLADADRDGRPNAERVGDELARDDAGAATGDDVPVDADEMRGPRAALGVRLAGGWQAALDGQSDPMQQGPWLGFALTLPALEIGLFGIYALPAKVDDGHTELAFARHGLGLQLALPLSLGSTTALAPVVGVGIAHERRSTRRTDPALEPTSQASAMLALATLSVELRQSLTRGRWGALGLSFSVGLWLMPRPSVLRYELAGQSVDRRMWALLPVARAGVYLQL